MTGKPAKLRPPQDPGTGFPQRRGREGRRDRGIKGGGEGWKKEERKDEKEE